MGLATRTSTKTSLKHSYKKHGDGVAFVFDNKRSISTLSVVNAAEEATNTKYWQDS